jgi:manganese/zinc/iron transport system permease protein
MKELIEFLSLSNANVRYVVLGVMLLGASTAVVGTFTFLRKKSLVGDAVAHAVLPGICLAFIFSQMRHPLVLLLGAFLSGWMSIVSIDFISKKSRIKADAAIAIVLTVFFGIGIMLLSYIQSTGNAAQSGIDHFLFGQAAALVGNDVILLAIVCVVLVVAVWLLFKEFTVLSFDAEYASALGLPVRSIEFILSTLTVIAIAVGIQAVGVVLMAAMLITPAAAARYWTNKLSVLIILAAAFGAFAGLFGSYISYTAPKMPTGPWIIIAITFIAFISMTFAPERGFFFKWLSKKRKTQNTMDENILKIFFHLSEQENNPFAKRKITALQERRYFEESKMRASLKRLCRGGLVSEQDGTWFLTEDGMHESKRIAKLHRLWEMYMSKFLRIPADHVHEGAESLEHFFTPELEAMLEEELGFPETDPHDKPIPYAKTVAS